MDLLPLHGGVYIDTSVVVASLFPGTPNSSACQNFTAWVQRSDVLVHYSQVLRVDYARAMRRLATKPGRLPEEQFRANRLDEWTSNPLIRQRWYARCARMLDDYLGQFPEVRELPLARDTWRLSVQIMGAETLDVTDAVHLATARLFGAEHFATTDADFARVRSPFVHLIRDDPSTT